LQFYPGSELLNRSSNWWGPSSSAVVAIMETGGFAIEHAHVGGMRGYFRAHVKPGVPPFVKPDLRSRSRSYEGGFYEFNLKPIFGPIKQWRRKRIVNADGTVSTALRRY